MWLLIKLSSDCRFFIHYAARYLYSMFIHADFQGKGIATMLLEEIERYAITKGIIQITSEVSLTARPFFEKQKYVVKKEQKRQANKLNLTNFLDGKNLICNKTISWSYSCLWCVLWRLSKLHTRWKNFVREQRKTKPAVKKCRTFYLCCVEKGITHCYQCHLFPCTKFKGFTKLG